MNIDPPILATLLDDLKTTPQLAYQLLDQFLLANQNLSANDLQPFTALKTKWFENDKAPTEEETVTVSRSTDYRRRDKAGLVVKRTKYAHPRFQINPYPTRPDAKGEGGCHSCHATIETGPILFHRLSASVVKNYHLTCCPDEFKNWLESDTDFLRYKDDKANSAFDEGSQ